MALSHLSTAEIVSQVSIAQAAATSTTTKVELVAAPGATRTVILGSVSITNKSATDTEVDLFDGSTKKDTIPAPANGGAVKRYLWGWPCTKAAALNFATLDSVDNVVVSVETRTHADAT